MDGAGTVPALGTLQGPCEPRKARAAAVATVASSARCASTPGHQATILLVCGWWLCCRSRFSGSSFPSLSCGQGWSSS